jgi:hypothetical protein
MYAHTTHASGAFHPSQSFCFSFFRYYRSRKSREKATAAIKEGQEQLEILKRQVILGRLYPSGKSVMEQI